MSHLVGATEEGTLEWEAPLDNHRRLGTLRTGTGDPLLLAWQSTSDTAGTFMILRAVEPTPVWPEGCGSGCLEVPIAFHTTPAGLAASRSPYSVAGQPLSGVCEYLFPTADYFLLQLTPANTAEARVVITGQRTDVSLQRFVRYGPAAAILVLYVGARVVGAVVAERKRLQALQSVPHGGAGGPHARH
eukprot:TRINITY_DN5034_c0_g1_i1.p1 TRINITY_DN5034_c0_g1~~TRINITY_DN5034_c0_g1_i1.p1  ORF type:complete len:188 (+),score=40.32 TRINITY_DN5034_c0_g1_i1:125-688(+)